MGSTNRGASVRRYWTAILQLLANCWYSSTGRKRGLPLRSVVVKVFRLRGSEKFVPAGWRFEASEFLERQVEVARLNNPGLKVRQESIYELTHSDETFDLVFLLEVLEHLDSPDAGLVEVLRILRPGGYLIAGVPREPLWRVLNMMRGKYLRALGNTPGHLNHWSSRGFRRYLTRSFGTIVTSRLPVPWVIVLAQKQG